jgi:phosphoglycerate kinase
MQFKQLTASDVKGKVIVVRADLNVPLKNGRITETTRIDASIPTLKFLLKHGAKRIHLLSHLGRPKGKNVPELSLQVLVSELESRLNMPIEFRKEFTVGKELLQLHENVRFWEEETKNDPQFTRQLLDGLKPEVFINDGFGVSHRAHASVVGLAAYLPSFPGLLVQNEINHLSPFLSTEKIPGLTVVVGGAKMETKINVLRHFARTAENILVGGALANTFLAAEGFDIGKSLYEKNEIENAREVLALVGKYNTGFHLPVDVVCAEAPKDMQSLDVPIEDVSGLMRIFDLGPHSVASFSEILQHSKMIIWNGPVGLFEYKNFENGTHSILKTIASQKSAQTILGGGDTLDALRKFGVSRTAFTHVSTGGGAMLEFLEGKDLPGLEVLTVGH